MYEKNLEKRCLLKGDDKSSGKLNSFGNNQGYSTFKSPFEHPVGREDLPSRTDGKSLFKQPCRLCRKVATQLTTLVFTGTRDLEYKVRLPANTAYRIAEDVILMSQHEPCGVNGCEINVRLQLDQSNSLLLGMISQSEGFVCTFQLDLVLRLRRIKPLDIALMCCSSKPARSVHERNYMLSKRKLYRSQEIDDDPNSAVVM